MTSESEATRSRERNAETKRPCLQHMQIHAAGHLTSHMGPCSVIQARRPYALRAFTKRHPPEKSNEDETPGGGRDEVAAAETPLIDQFSHQPMQVVGRELERTPPPLQIPMKGTRLRSLNLISGKQHRSCACDSDSCLLSSTPKAWEMCLNNEGGYQSSTGKRAPPFFRTVSMILYHRVSKADTNSPSSRPQRQRRIEQLTSSPSESPPKAP